MHIYIYIYIYTHLVRLHYIVLYCITSYYIILHYVILYYVILNYIVLCYYVPLGLRPRFPRAVDSPVSAEGLSGDVHCSALGATPFPGALVRWPTLKNGAGAET